MFGSAELKVSGTGSTHFACGSLEVIVVGPLTFSPFDSWTRESRIWDKQQHILDANPEHIQTPGDPCPSTAKYCHLAGMTTESSTVVPGQLPQEAEEHGTSSQFYEHGSTSMIDAHFRRVGIV